MNGRTTKRYPTPMVVASLLIQFAPSARGGPVDEFITTPGVAMIALGFAAWVAGATVYVAWRAYHRVRTGRYDGGVAGRAWLLGLGGYLLFNTPFLFMSLSDITVGSILLLNVFSAGLIALQWYQRHSD